MAAIRSSARRWRGLILAALMVVVAASAHAAPRRSDIVVSGAWARPAAAGMNGAAYLVIANRGASPDALVAASSPLASAVSLHRSAMIGTVMTMRPVAAVVLPPRSSVALRPGGLHLMLSGLKRGLRVGETAPLRLQFRASPPQVVEIRIALGPPS